MQAAARGPVAAGAAVVRPRLLLPTTENTTADTAAGAVLDGVEFLEWLLWKLHTFRHAGQIPHDVRYTAAVH